MTIYQEMIKAVADAAHPIEHEDLGDPHHIQETTMKFETIKAGPWHATEGGRVSRRKVLSKCLDRNEWCTHIETGIHKAGGNYFTTLEAAWDDFDKRVVL